MPWRSSPSMRGSSSGAVGFVRARDARRAHGTISHLSFEIGIFMRLRSHAVLLVLAILVLPLRAFAQAPVTYRVSFPAPEHHYAQIEVTFPNVPGETLETRMSRSSPGRYAVHEYAKNVFELQAFDGKGTPLATARPNPYQWDVAGHDGTVRIVYKIYGDYV